MTDIGKPEKEIQVDPVVEPVPEVLPLPEPEQVPDKEREKVPA